jgi:hypothetical protein
VTDFFSPDYFTARTRFCSGVLANGGQIESIVLDAKGPRGEDLSIDIGWFGSPEPKRAFVHSSGLHGVEGFAGSAIQLQWLEEIYVTPHDCAVVMVHIMNPFGMAWLRRVNENNVDLNHNFLAADEKYEGGPGRLRAAYRMLRGKDFEGQYEFPQGLAYGGKRHEQTTRRYQLYISGKLANAERIVAIDVHTGPGGQAKGSLGGLYRRMFPGTEVRFTEQQFATVNGLRVLAALNSGNNQFEVFCPRSIKWRNQVLESGKEAINRDLPEAFEPLSPANSMPPD